MRFSFEHDSPHEWIMKQAAPFVRRRIAGPALPAAEKNYVGESFVNDLPSQEVSGPVSTGIL
jgi:hypothetical protein